MEEPKTNVLIDDMIITFKSCAELARQKNNDYAGENTPDPYRNFRNSSIVGIPPQHGVLVRMTDKLVRIGNLMKQDAQVKDESIDDTLDDLINYAAILKSMRKRDIK
jgi:hypothetical protein